MLFAMRITRLVSGGLVAGALALSAPAQAGTPIVAKKPLTITTTTTTTKTTAGYSTPPGFCHCLERKHHKHHKHKRHHRKHHKKR
jgi:hypothetical protein